MIAPGELDSADAYCQRLARRHYENFVVISRFTPARLRTHLARVYAFCRFTDDLGDEGGSQVLERLDLWLAQTRDLFHSSRAPLHPVLLSLSQTVSQFGLSEQPFVDLIRANRQDQLVTAYATWEHLQEYCLLSAAPVGRIVLHLFGMGSELEGRLSDSVCIGLQLANFAQDVSVDSARGRSYLIGDELRVLGTTGAVRSLCRRAQTLLSAGRDLEARAPKRLRLQLALYRLGGMAIVSAIERLDFRTDLVRPTVPLWTKAKLVPAALLGAGGPGQLSVPGGAAS